MKCPICKKAELEKVEKGHYCKSKKCSPDGNVLRTFDEDYAFGLEGICDNCTANIENGPIIHCPNCGASWLKPPK